MGVESSIVDVRPAADGDRRTVLDLEHSVPLEIAGSGAGALYVGPGWDISVQGLATFLDGVVVDDAAAWEGSLEAQRFSARSIAAWTEAVGSGDTATADEISVAAETARAQFAPDLPAGDG